MINAINIILQRINQERALKSLTPWTLNTTKANASLKINIYLNSQTKAEELISQICDYTDHIWQVKDNVLHLYDKNISNGTIQISLGNILMDSYSITYNDIIKGWEAKWETYAYDSNNNDLKANSKAITVTTGMDSGQMIELTPLDYIDANIQAILNRKKVLYDYARGSVTVVGLLDLKPCMEVTLDYTDSWVNFQKLRVFEWEWDFNNQTTTMSGIILGG